MGWKDKLTAEENEYLKEFIEKQKANCFEEMSSLLLDELQIVRKRGKTKKNPAFIQKVMNRLKTDELYQSYINESCFLSKDFQNNFSEYVKRRIAEKDRQRKLIETKKQWKTWKETISLDSLIQKTCSNITDNVIQWAENVLKNKEIFYLLDASFTSQKRLKIKEIPLAKENIENYLSSFYWSWIPLSGVIGTEAYRYGYVFYVTGQMIKHNPELSSIYKTLNIFDELYLILSRKPLPTFVGWG